jgi:type IV pilus assembly protein PilV
MKRANVKATGGIDQARGQAGVVLLEVLVAVLIFSIGVLAIIGLQAAAITTVADARYRVDASSLANQVIGRMWVDQANLANYAGADVDVPELPNGKRTITVAGSAVTVTITWQPPEDSSTHTFSTVARIY